MYCHTQKNNTTTGGTIIYLSNYMTKSTHGHLLRDAEHQSKFPEKQFNMIFKTQVLIWKNKHISGIYSLLFLKI